jgi:DNA-binding MarR family transcriptional regulator
VRLHGGHHARRQIVSLLTISLFSRGRGDAREGLPQPDGFGTSPAYGLPPAVNDIFFSCKRAFHRTLAVTRRPLAVFGLTAARFDMLYEISRSRMFGMMQSCLRRALGVTAATVSRMLRSLEQLGLVKRRRDDGDTRQRWVTLTNLGRRRIRLAQSLLVRWGAVQLVVDCVLTYDCAHDPDACFTAMCNADAVLGSLRKGLGDTASLFYPWHPDD